MNEEFLFHFKLDFYFFNNLQKSEIETGISDTWSLFSLASFYPQFYQEYTFTLLNMDTLYTLGNTMVTQE